MYLPLSFFSLQRDTGIFFLVQTVIASSELPGRADRQANVFLIPMASGMDLGSFYRLFPIVLNNVVQVQTLK